MSHAATYHTDESGDSESEQNYSDNEGIVFTESNRKLAEEKNNGQVQKSRSRQPKHDVDTSLIDGEVVRLKKRRRTAEVNDLPLHDEDDLSIGSGQTPLKSKSRIWNEQMVKNNLWILIYTFILYLSYDFFYDIRILNLKMLQENLKKIGV